MTSSMWQQIYVRLTAKLLRGQLDPKTNLTPCPNPNPNLNAAKF